MDIKKILLSIKSAIVTYFTSESFKRIALRFVWNSVNAIIALVVTNLTNAGLVEAAATFAIINGATKELANRYIK